MKNLLAANICYTYDGTYYGMLSCVFEAFSKKEMPLQIDAVTNNQPASLLVSKFIATNGDHAKRILDSIPHKISPLALEYVKLCYLSSVIQKEIALIHLLTEGYHHGHNFIQSIRTGFSPSRKLIASALKNDHIKRLEKGINLLTRDAHMFVQFVRFSEVNGALVSIIEPEHNVLPLLGDHFTSRFKNEQFLIYDKTRSLALIYLNGKLTLEYIDNYQIPLLSDDEKKYQKLWQLFFNAVAIKERVNHRCQTNFLPKKYRSNMTEFM